MAVWDTELGSTEWIGPITVTKLGVPTEDFQVLVQHASDRSEPSGWTTPTEITEEGLGVMVGPGTTFPLERGAYIIKTRAVDSPESPVRAAGVIYVR